MIKPEVWRPVPSFEEYYSISNFGKIKSHHKRNKDCLIAPRLDRGGYLSVRLSKQGKTHTRFLHRLLAEAFIPNPKGYPYVNHRNGNKPQNDLRNLEWVTHAQNIQHAFDNGLCKKHDFICKKVIEIGSGRVFNSIRAAAKYYSIPYSTCKNYLNGNRPNPTKLRFLD